MKWSRGNKGIIQKPNINKQIYRCKIIQKPMLLVYETHSKFGIYIKEFPLYGDYYKPILMQKNS